MALFMPSNISPSMLGELGNGTIDVTEPLVVQWQVNGNSAMTAFSITIQQNNADSTQMYTTGKITSTAPQTLPFYGVDKVGDVQFFSYTIPSATLTDAGMVNGNEYKIVIQQWWTNDDSITQASPSVFRTRAKPALTMTVPNTVTSSEQSFSAAYAQTQGDALNFVRWQLISITSGETLYDSGNIYGTAELGMDYDGFFKGQQYSIKCTVQTENGVETDTGWNTFTVDYAVSPASGAVQAHPRRDVSAVYVSWSGISGGGTALTGYTVYRMESGDTVMRHVADVEASENGVADCTAASQHTYTYYVVGYGEAGFATALVESNAVTPVFWDWTVLSCTPADDGAYHPTGIFRFGKNLASGAVANNSAANIMENFTRYPTVQQSPQNFLSGTLVSLIGTISALGEYSDTLTERNAIYALSTSPATLFLKNRKGDLWRICVPSAVSMETWDNSRQQAQTVTLPWMECGDADGDRVILTAADELFPAP